MDVQSKHCIYMQTRQKKERLKQHLEVGGQADDG